MIKKKTIPDLQTMSDKEEKITMLTAYDYPTASILEQAGIDTILVGDSLGMVVLGYDTTVPVTVDEMLHHAKAVRRGAPNTFVIVDMPYLSYATENEALMNARKLMKEAGADAVKLEGGEDYAPIIRFLTKAGIPVVGHIGLTPQTASQLGGFKVQGKDVKGALKLLQDAKTLKDSGVIMIVLEAIPAQLAQKITNEIKVPTIGIGAGQGCSGQVLVFHDLIGLFDKFVPKFVKQYDTLRPRITEAVQKYCEEVKQKQFPAEHHTFTINDDVLERLYGGKDE